MEELRWEASERERREPGAPWYWLIGAVTVVLSLVAIAQGNFFFFVFIALAGVLLIVSGRGASHLTVFSVESKGITAGGVFFPYGEIEFFSLRERAGGAGELVFKKKSGFPPHVRIPVRGVMVPRAVAALEERLPRVEHEDSLVDLLGEWMGL